MKAIILAAGFGTRLYPLTKDKPKALLPLKGKPLIDYLMQNLAQTRPESVTLVTNHLFYEQFIFWKSRREFPFPLHILNNGAGSPEEGRGAVVDLFYGVSDPRSKGSDFFVLSSDNYFDYPLRFFLLPALHHLPEPVIGVYDVKETEEARRFGVVALDANSLVTGFFEKPANPISTLASIGIYVLPRSIHPLLYEYLRLCRGNKDQLGDFVAWLSKRMRMLAVPIEGIWNDIGNIQAYKSCVTDLEKDRTL